MEEPDGGTKRSPVTGWMIVVIVLIVAGAAVGITALVTNRQRAVGPPASATSTSRAASPATVPAVPLVVVCSGTPAYEPKDLYWCVSACSAYLENIKWTTWNAETAVGTGTYVTNNGIPNCAAGTRTDHPDYPVTLSKPKGVDYCIDDTETSGVLFTSVSIFEYPVPLFHPPCT